MGNRKKYCDSRCKCNFESVGSCCFGRTDMKRIDSDDLLIISRFRRLKPWLKPTIHKRKLETKNEIDNFLPIKKEKRKKKVDCIPKYVCYFFTYLLTYLHNNL